MLIYIVYLTKIREIDVLFLMNIQKYTKYNFYGNINKTYKNN